MKFILAAASLLACGAAQAQQVEVAVPADLAAPDAAAAYTSSLIDAVDKVCAREAGPVIGVGYYVFWACVKQTRIDVAAKDPTGLLARRLGLNDPVRVAAR
jgi:hypothetical protein